MQLAKMPEVSRMCAEPKSTLYWRISLGTFPPAIKLGPRAAAFDVAEVEAVIRARAAGASNELMREVVRELVANRKTGAHMIGEAGQQAAR